MHMQYARLLHTLLLLLLLLALSAFLLLVALDPILPGSRHLVAKLLEKHGRDGIAHLEIDHVRHLLHCTWGEGSGGGWEERMGWKAQGETHGVGGMG